MHDSHVHLNLNPLSNNLPDVVTKFQNNGGKYILTQSTDLVDIDETLEIASRYPEVIDVALGLHPTCFEEYTLLKGKRNNIYEFSQKYITQWEEKFLKNREKIKAIGETGLDYYQFRLNQTNTQEQIAELREIEKLSFNKQVNLALKYHLPLSIHARDFQGESACVADALRIVAQEGKGLVKGSFHSYTGDISFIEEILDLGFYVGFNGIITYKSGENVREILKVVPVERILFETDGPFLPPQSVRKNSNIKEKFAQPSDVREIMNVAAEIKGVNIEKLEKITDENYQLLFH